MTRKFETIRGHTVYGAALGPDSIIVDLGANRGEFSRQMSARFGGRYYLVEANPHLAAQVRAEGRFQVWNYAVTNTDGSLQLNIAHNDEGSSILPLPSESVFDCVLTETVEVPARRIESLLGELHEPRIDLLKMDIEGAEMAALDSLSPASLRAIGQITVEFHSDPLFGFDVHRDVEASIRRLRNLGFICLDFSVKLRDDMLFVNRVFHGISRWRAAQWQFRREPPLGLGKLWRMLPESLQQAMRQPLDHLTSMPPRD